MVVATRLVFFRKIATNHPRKTPQYGVDNNRTTWIIAPNYGDPRDLLLWENKCYQIWLFCHEIVAIFISILVVSYPFFVSGALSICMSMSITSDPVWVNVHQFAGIQIETQLLNCWKCLKNGFFCVKIGQFIFVATSIFTDFRQKIHFVSLSGYWIESVLELSEMRPTIDPLGFQGENNKNRGQF